MHDDAAQRPPVHDRRVGDRSSMLTRRLVAPNAGPMTLDGTNSYLIAGGDSTRVVIVDPGPLDEDHLGALAAAGTVALVLLTHRHLDHSASRERFAALAGAPVRAFDPAFCVDGFGVDGFGVDGQPLADGEEIREAGVRIRVLHTPGHSSDSVCFFLPDDGPRGSMLTGDTILGRGTTIIDHPDGTLGAYLDSLAVLRAFGAASVLPAHGGTLPDLAAVCDAYREHRERRLEQIRLALADLGPDAAAEAVTDVVYADADAGVRFAAEASVRAQLSYLRG